MTLYFCVCVSNLTNITENVPPPPLSFWQRNKTFNGVQSLCYIMLNISPPESTLCKIVIFYFFSAKLEHKRRTEEAGKLNKRQMIF